jgi:hypothetical protein
VVKDQESPSPDSKKDPLKIRSLLHLYETLPEDQRIMVDVLRQIVAETLPAHCKEKISYNVPFFYGRKSICLIWPSAIPRGGIKEGVMLAFWYGNKLPDANNYLSHGTNKQVFYKIFLCVDEIDEEAIVSVLHEAILIDASW